MYDKYANVLTGTDAATDMSDQYANFSSAEAGVHGEGHQLWHGPQQGYVSCLQLTVQAMHKL